MGSRSGRKASIGGGNISLFGIMTAFLPSFDTLYSSAKDPAKVMANLQRMPADAKAQAVAFLTWRRKMEQDLGNRLVNERFFSLSTSLETGWCRSAKGGSAWSLKLSLEIPGFRRCWVFLDNGSYGPPLSLTDS